MIFFDKKGLIIMSIKDYNVNELFKEYKEKYNIEQPDLAVAVEIADILKGKISIFNTIRLLEEKNQGDCSHSDIAKMVVALSPRGLALLEDVEKKKLTFEEKISLSLQTLPLKALMNRYDEDMMKQDLLEALTLTQTYLPYEDIDLIYSKDLIDTQKEKKPTFVLQKNDRGEFQITSVYKLLSDQTYTLNVNDISLEKLNNLANMWVAAQLNGYGSIKDSLLTQEQIKELSKAVLMSTHLIKDNFKNPKKEINQSKLNKLTKNVFKKNLSQGEILKLKSEAQEIHPSVYKDVDEVARAFVSANKMGRNITTTFNGKELYSFETKTLNDVYVKCTGKTKEDHIQEDKRMKQTIIKTLQKQREELEKVQTEKVKELLRDSKGLVDKRLKDEWKNCLKNFYNTKDIIVAIDMLRALKEGKPFNEVEKMLIKNSGISTDRIFSIMLNFSERGTDFVTQSKIRPLEDVQLLSEQQKFKFQAMSNNFSDNEMKDYFLHMLTVTNTPISKKDAQDLLPQKITNQMIDNGKYITKKESSGYYFGIFTYQGIPFIELSKNKDEIDVFDLAKLLKNTMTEYKESGQIYANSYLTKEVIEDVIDLTLKTIDYLFEHVNEKPSIAEEVLNNDTTTISASFVDEQEFDERE
jgi:hypothetical protein